MAVRIILADDNQKFREQARALLEGQADFQVIAEATDGREAVELAGQLQPDVVILDYSMPKLDGISAIPLIRNRAPQASIVLLTIHDARFTVRRAFDAGASSYVLKSEVVKDLAPAVEAASRHQSYFRFTPST